MGVRRFHHCLCWHPDLLVPLPLLENFQAYPLGSTGRGRSPHWQGSTRCCRFELARAKTEEYVGEDMVLDSLKMVHIYPYLKIAIISPIVFYPSAYSLASSIKISTIPCYVTFTQPSRVLSVRFIRTKQSNRPSVPQVRLHIGKAV